MKKLFIVLTVGLLAAACDSGANYPKPGATGKTGELLVIIDNVYWDSELGDTIRAVFQRPYPVLPQEESSFTLLPVANSSFLPVMQRHRNILLITLAKDSSEARLTVSRDLWAQPQIALNAVGPDLHSIARVISDKRDLMMKLYEQAEIERQSESARIYTDPKIQQIIKDSFGINLNVTTDYHLMRNDRDFIWLESQSNHNSLGIFVYSYPFTDDSTFTVKYLVNKRNALLKEKVHGARDSSWMTTSVYLTPELEIKEYKGLTYGELRGLWELVNDYMGGPFISRSYIDRARGLIITVEGYVYAPRFNKRDYLRRMAGIVNTLSFL
jgi:hypothetical protein